jgi:hypothetical protein
MTTAEQVLAALALYDLKREGKEYRCNSPLRPGSNSHGFRVTIDDGEHGAYHDHVSGDSGSLYDLAKALGIALPEKPAADMPKGYSGLAEYAIAHGVDASVFEAAGWIESEFKSRKVLKFMTANGYKVRNLDGEKPKFQPTELGYKLCLYGMKYGIPMAQEKNILVITNGEPSVIVAQHFGIPAVCHTGGETTTVPDSLIDEIRTRFQGEIIVALDCDGPGRKGAGHWRDAFVRNGITPRVVDMRLMDKGDLADFCMLYEGNSLEALKKCELLFKPDEPPKVEKLLMTRGETLAEFNRQLLDTYVPDVPPMINPLKVLHKFGGEAHVLEPGQLVGFVGSSGSGKTSMLETVMDALLRLNKNILVWSPEWKPIQLAQRAIQRYEGPTMEALRLHKLWLYEKHHGITDGEGIAISKKTASTAFDTAEQIAGFPGEAAYVPNSTLSVDHLIEQYPQMLAEFGRPFHAMVIDYVQLMHALEKTGVGMYDVLMKIRHMCMKYDLVGFTASQVTKNATAAQKDNQLLESEAARFVNNDAFNLVVTINPEFAPDGTWMNSGVLKIDKNSSGRKGQVRVKMNLSLLSWIDQETTDQNMSRYEKRD